ncbi:MAG: hypothetical protein PHU58_07715 [Prevotella sp.]|nr:hypothetical protein [Prevotella sp.]
MLIVIVHDSIATLYALLALVADKDTPPEASHCPAFRKMIPDGQRAHILKEVQVDAAGAFCAVDAVRDVVELVGDLSGNLCDLCLHQRDLLALMASRTSSGSAVPVPWK